MQTHSKLINWYANILSLQSFQVTVFELAVLQASISRLQLLKTSLFWLLVSSRPPQGDMRVFAKCKDNHWAINEGQKGTISGVSTRANCRRCEAARALGRRTRRQTQKLVFKLPHANARSRNAGVYCSPRCDSWLGGRECLPAECGTAVGVCLNRGGCQLLLGFCLALFPKIRKVKCSLAQKLAARKKIIKS